MRRLNNKSVMKNMYSLGDRSVKKDMYSILHILQEKLINKSMEVRFDEIYMYFEQDDKYKLGKSYIRNLLTLLKRELFVDIFTKQIEKATKNTQIYFSITESGIEWLEIYLKSGGLTILNEIK